jgi:thymidine kinase
MGGGYLGIILGPMFSGKTTRLVQIYKTRTYIQKKVAVINYVGDTRYSTTGLSTHDGISIPCIFTERLDTIYDHPDIQSADTILINEGQLFPDIVETVLKLVENNQKEVFVCGLDGDYKRNLFGDLLKLIPYCDSVEKLHALCAKCRNGTQAIYSHRISNETEQVVIGSSNYMPLCRSCYNQV